MAEAIFFDLLQITFGLISSKLRSYGAEKLQDGGLTDQTLRGWIIRELDDIKFKLDAISRKDLSMGISCLQQGTKRLMISFSESFGSRNLPILGPVFELQPDARQGLNVGLQQASLNVADSFSFVDFVGKIKIDSSERFNAAKHSFIKAGEKASEAFHNAALDTNERILASKVRIACGILANLDDPQVAVCDCLHYLQELHSLTAIKEIFSVHRFGGIRSLFNKESRAEVVNAIVSVNFLLADFTSKFTDRRMGVFDWPMIKCRKQTVHPIHYEIASVGKIKEMGIALPWNTVIYKTPIDNINMHDFSVNGNGDVIGVFHDSCHPQKLDRKTGEWKAQLQSPSVDKACYCRSAVVDDNGTIYMVSCKQSNNLEDTLSVFHLDGELIYQCPLNFLIKGAPVAITMTDDNNIILCCFKGLGCNNGTLYVSNTDGNLIVSFPIRLSCAFERVLGLFVCKGDSGDDEVTVATGMRNFNELQIFLYVYTQGGVLTRRTKYCQETSAKMQEKVTFDHVSKNYIVVTTASISDNVVRVGCISETGELRNSIFLDKMNITNDGYEGCLISHRNGAIALVSSDKALYLQSTVV